MGSHLPTRAAVGAVILTVLVAGCSDSEEPSAPQDPAATGKIAYSFVATLGGGTENAVHIFDLATRTETVFRAVDSPQGGVTAARDGTIAELGELDDAAQIRLSDPDGTIRNSFIVRAELSFATSGAAIAPDASRVAFSFDVALSAGRGARSYICPAAGDGTACSTFEDVKSPAWAPDGRLLAVNEDQTALFLSDAGLNQLTRVPSRTLIRAENPVMTPDGKYVVFDEGDIPRLALLELATGTVTALTEGGLGQFRAALSPDGATLLFGQKCCGGLGIQVVALHAIPFTIATSRTPIAVNTVDDQAGDPVFIDGRVGWF